MTVLSTRSARVDKNSDDRNEHGNSEDGEKSAFPYEKGLHENTKIYKLSCAKIEPSRNRKFCLAYHFLP